MKRFRKAFMALSHCGASIGGFAPPSRYRRVPHAPERRAVADIGDGIHTRLRGEATRRRASRTVHGSGPICANRLPARCNAVPERPSAVLTSAEWLSACGKLPINRRNPGWHPRTRGPRHCGGPVLAPGVRSLGADIRNRGPPLGRRPAGLRGLGRRSQIRGSRHRTVLQ
jgi:hypothetical protein